MMQDAMMTCMVLEAPGQPLQKRERPVPVPRPGEILVKVAASGINPLDLKIRAGAAAHAQHPLPAILGIDLAGTVAAVGADVTGFAAGDAVYGVTGGVGGHQGSLAQYAAVDARLLALAPRNLSPREAAAIPLAFLTAWEGLVDRAHVGKEMHVLVQGGAGGVGRIAVQIARSFGAQVTATGSAQNLMEIQANGAVAIDRHASDVASYVETYTGGRGFDIVFDTAGGKALDASFQAVSRHGHVVSALGWGSHSLASLSFKGASYSGIFTLLPLLSGEGRAHFGAALKEATRLAESGCLRPKLDDRIFDLDQANDAHDLVAQDNHRGKVVITVPHVT